MATRLSVRDEVRSVINQWPDVVALAEDLDTVETVVDVADATLAPGGSIIEIDSELMRVRSIDTVPTPDTLIVRRGDRGTTAATHSNGASIRIYGPHDPTDTQLNRWIRDGIDWLYPTLVRDIWDTTDETELNVLNYPVPAAIHLLEEVLLRDDSDPARDHPIRKWTLIDEDVWFPAALPEGRMLTFHGRGKFTQPTTDTGMGGTLDVPNEVLAALHLYVVAQVVKQQEIMRSRFVDMSALLESRAGNIPDLIGSSRDLLRQAAALRDAQASPRPWRLRAITRRP